MMKTVFYVMTAAGALAAAAPALAQSATSNVNGGAGISNRIVQLNTRLQTGISQGAISQQEARTIRPQLRELTRLERQYSRNGLTQQERADLQQRIRNVRKQLRTADGGANGRYASWDNEDAYNGQGGPYEEATCETPTGVGGFIQGVLGRGTDCSLNVGDRVPGNLGAVPYAYRNQYRDGNGVYYRSDGRSIYQIDARNHTVVRSYPVSR